MDKEKEIRNLVKEINSQLHKLEVSHWEVYVSPGYTEPSSDNSSYSYDYEIRDKETGLFYGTRILYYKICLFLELKNVPAFHKIFTSKFGPIIDIEKEVMKGRGPLYEDSDPSMIILDDFREFLIAFSDFKDNASKKYEINKLKLILENTNSIVAKTNTNITNETSIYKPVKWIVEIIYPKSRNLGKARFIKKFSTYHPDILVPEISSAVEYKFIRKGKNPEHYLDQIKTDADNYKGDSEYTIFIAIVYFEDKAELNPESFKQAVFEKSFPENWTIMAL